MFSDNKFKDRLTALLIIMGISVAVLSDLQEKIPEIAAFCGFFSIGCRQTLQYELLTVPISLWGMGYYVLLALTFLVRRHLVFPLLMAGMGTEMVLVRIMFEQIFFCVFCVANAVIMLLLFLVCFNRKKITAALAIGLVLYIVSHELISTPLPGIAAKHRLDDTVLATVNGNTITADRVERLLTTRLYKLDKNAYQLKKHALEYLINESLLEQEAAEQGLTLSEFKSALRGKVSEPPDSEIEFYFNQKAYKNHISDKGTEAEIKQRIKAYVHQQQMDRMVLNHAQRLKQEADVSIYLEAPPLPFTQIRLSGSPAAGPKDAPVTVIEFSDYLCPSCRKGHQTANWIKEKYKGKIRWVFKDFPLNIHPGAKELAIAAGCAGDQGKFWEYQDRLFSSPKPPEPSSASQFAKALDLDLERFNTCLADGENAGRLEEEIRQATLAGISSTPTLIINGRLHIGIPSFEKLSEMIDQALSEADEALPLVK